MSLHLAKPNSRTASIFLGWKPAHIWWYCQSV